MHPPTSQPDDDDPRLSVVANAIGYEMLRHDGRPIDLDTDEVEQIDVTDQEAQRCLAAARRVLGHLAAFDACRGRADS